MAFRGESYEAVKLSEGGLKFFEEKPELSDGANRLSLHRITKINLAHYQSHGVNGGLECD